MSTDLWPEGYDRIDLDQVDSTNAEASRIAPELARPTWIVARQQTAGRGRLGRDWGSGDGNLTATLVMRPQGPVADVALRTFFAANAVFETLALHVDRTTLAQKWPNDILLNGGKVAGILLEAAGGGPEIDWLTIGIGINLASAPELAGPFAPVSLAGETGNAPEPDDILPSLAGFLATEEKIFAEMGFGPIRERWLRHAARLGEVITARTQREEVTGRFETLDEAGRLVLATDDGMVPIAAADIFFPD